MDWDRDEVRRLLDAEIIDEAGLDGAQRSIIRFRDKILLYEVWITKGEDNVLIAGDPERPIQGLPTFEISILCTKLAPLPRTAMPLGLGFYSGTKGAYVIRFSITRREDGNISLSG